MTLSTNVIVAIVFLVVLVAFFLYKNFLAHKKPVLAPEEESTVLSTYGGAKKDQEQKLTLKERIELSWKFLYEITEIIMNKFSREDVDLVNRCGHLLLDNGGKYQHVVDLALQQHANTRAVDQTQSKGTTRGV